MIIGLDISQIVYKGTGVSRFTEGLVDTILQYDKENKWIFFFSSLRQSLPTELIEKIKSKNHKLIVWRIPPTLLAFLWNDLHTFSQFFTFSPIGRLAFGQDFSLLTSCDWYISSDWSEPKTNCKKATIVHDLVFMRYPETVDKKILSTQKKRLHWVKKESTVIFADSEATKKDLIEFMKIDNNRIKVLWPGIETIQPENKKDVLNKFSLKKPYILTVGKLEPRKNLQRLFEAFKQINTDIELLVVGPQGWGKMEVTDARIRYIGFISDEELYALYKSSLFFIFPSIWEGFGYPAVEAMKLGVPIVLSNTSSLKEIGEGVAEFFDPHDVESIKTAMQKLINDNDLRERIRLKGLKKSAQFSWKKYYDEMIKTLKNNYS